MWKAEKKIYALRAAWVNGEKISQSTRPGRQACLSYCVVLYVAADSCGAELEWGAQTIMKKKKLENSPRIWVTKNVTEISPCIYPWLMIIVRTLNLGHNIKQITDCSSGLTQSFPLSRRPSLSVSLLIVSLPLFLLALSLRLFLSHSSSLNLPIWFRFLLCYPSFSRPLSIRLFLSHSCPLS